MFRCHTPETQGLTPSGPPALSRLLVALGLGALALLLAACESMPPFPALPIVPTPVTDPASDSSSPAVPLPESRTELARSTNILLMGTDRVSHHGSWRTDALILAMISPDKEEITLVSLPRDWYVEVPGFGTMRINQVDFIGERQEPGLGPQLFQAVLEQYMGIELHHWARFHMNGFHEVFQLIEPIWIVLACPFYERIWDARTGEMEWYHIPAGEVQMDAHTAFLYVRLRGFSTDFGRLVRQRNLLWALRNQMDMPTVMSLFPQLVALLDQNFQTDLSLPELLDWAQLGMSLAPHKVKGVSVDRRFVVDDVTPGGAAIQRLRQENSLHDLMGNPDQYVLPLDASEGQTCRLPSMSDAAFQRITRLENLVPSLLRPGTPVALIATSRGRIQLYSDPGLHSNLIGELETGTPLTVLQHLGYLEHPVPATGHRWYYVETADQTRGWVSDRYLRLLSQ